MARIPDTKSRMREDAVYAMTIAGMPDVEIAKLIWRLKIKRPKSARLMMLGIASEMRGVKKPGAVTVTSSIRGSFLEKAVREEFLDLLRRS